MSKKGAEIVKCGKCGFENVAGAKYCSNCGRKIAVSVVAVVVGFGSTFMLFLLGLRVAGVIGPAWVIFLINGWKLWSDRAKLKASL